MKSLLKNKLSGLLASPVVTGVEVIIRSDNEFLFNAVVIERKKENIQVIRKVSGATSFDKIIEVIEKNAPVVLAVNGKGIIHRKMQVNERNNASLVAAILPNAREEDFYIQNFSDAFVSIIRRSALDTIINEFSSRKIWVCEVSTGPFSIQAATALLSGDELQAGDYKVKFAEGEISAIELTEPAGETGIRIGNECLGHAELIPFGAAFGCLLEQGSRPAMTLTAVSDVAKEFFYSKVFKASGWGVLITFFVVLLLNFILFSFYSDKLSRAQSLLTAGQKQMLEFNSLKKEIEEKEKFLKESGLSTSSRTSFFADRIAKELPRDISLEQLHINPSEKKIKDGEPVNFTHKAILVKGSCSNSPVLNSWIKILKEKDWVTDVEVLNYDHSGTGSKGYFELRINVL